MLWFCLGLSSNDCPIFKPALSEQAPKVIINTSDKLSIARVELHYYCYCLFYTPQDDEFKSLVHTNMLI